MKLEMPPYGYLYEVRIARIYVENKNLGYLDTRTRTRRPPHFLCLGRYL